jgi:hypothetical protein
MAIRAEMVTPVEVCLRYTSGMTAQELIAHQITDCGYQLERVFNGIDESTADLKVGPEAMSPRETAAHLIECCQAFLVEADGASYDWGSMQMEDTSWARLMDVLVDKRQEAAVKVANGDDRVLKLASSFLVIHDAYHIGQMAQLRIHHTEGWDPYSIYRSE